MNKKIHIFGASGSGTTTLGKALAEYLQIRHFDTDDFYWLKTDPPYQTPRERQERQNLLLNELKRHHSWILSGSLCGWGDVTIPLFDQVIFLWLPTAIRLERLKKREIERYGSDILQPNHPRYHQYKAFLEYAASYEEGGLEIRSKLRHDQWMQELPCPVVKIETDTTVVERLNIVLHEIELLTSKPNKRTCWQNNHQPIHTKP